MLNSAEHEIFSASKYENANKLLAEKFSCSAMFGKKKKAIVSSSIFVSRTNFMLSLAEHERSYITSKPMRKSHFTMRHLSGSTQFANHPAFFFTY